MNKTEMKKRLKKIAAKNPSLEATVKKAIEIDQKGFDPEIIEDAYTMLRYAE